MTDIGEAFLARLEQLADAATPGPWVNPDGYCVRHHDRDNWLSVCRVWATNQSVEQGVDDMEFIAATRAAVPALIAEIRRLRALLFRAHEEFESLEDQFDEQPWPHLIKTDMAVVGDLRAEFGVEEDA